MKKSDIPAIILLSTLLFMLVMLCRACNNETKCTNVNTDKRYDCVLHLHNAGKALSLSELETELQTSLECLPAIKKSCDDNDFDSKVTVIKSLLSEVQAASLLDKAQQEAMFQKVNRVLFEGGTSCYKGHCQYNETLLICQHVRTDCE